MASKHSLIVSVLIAIIALLCFLAMDPKKPTQDLSLLRQNIDINDPRLSRLYRAPLYKCDLPDKVDKSYCVFLREGSLLEDHTLRVEAKTGARLRPTKVFFAAHRLALEYCENGAEDVMLDAIRADKAVEWVECERKVGEEEISDEL
ncbi:hypothetical protein CKM354_000054700 [Cercospora kikuchii]|uniref:Uncharacterized protein n=1 Tax=Cercospora kikuchii TaxID=84275 RepID=A0A9P3C613_9PEZI|nr:uncharacterized protein CKM354_000054700 [Cercospora kikuchii]GIZ37084.1 hypothetical protein CKM354_000054700 [Cercospora kikuchii]